MLSVSEESEYIFDLTCSDWLQKLYQVDCAVYKKDRCVLFIFSCLLNELEVLLIFSNLW